MSKQIQVGSVAVGGGAPVSIQSMCNTPTRDVEATVGQILRLEEAGCENHPGGRAGYGGSPGCGGDQTAHPHPPGVRYPF